jgi:tRNA dimethylallyltransferase
MADDVLVITGPTAAGKTAVAIKVAKRLGGEIISMDSRQVYRGMDIGTAKPTLAERCGVRHHGFDLVEPDERYSAGRFARDARGWIHDIQERGRVPILAGGTGFFLRTLTHPLFQEPEMPGPEREALDRMLRDQSRDDLRRWATALDPGAGTMLEGGRQRFARVIEVALLTGRPLSWWHRNAPDAAEPLRPVIFVLNVGRHELFRRIDNRVLRMVEDGLADEVRALVGQGLSASDPGMNATGYAEFIPYLAGERTLAEAIALTQAATRRYARRQMTWLRHQLPEGAVWIEADRPTDEIAGAIELLWNRERAS